MFTDVGQNLSVMILFVSALHLGAKPFLLLLRKYFSAIIKFKLKLSIEHCNVLYLCVGPCLLDTRSFTSFKHVFFLVYKRLCIKCRAVICCLDCLDYLIMLYLNSVISHNFFSTFLSWYSKLHPYNLFCYNERETLHMLQSLFYYCKYNNDMVSLGRVLMSRNKRFCVYVVLGQ